MQVDHNRCRALSGVLVVASGASCVFQLDGLAKLRGGNSQLRQQSRAASVVACHHRKSEPDPKKNVVPPMA